MSGHSKWSKVKHQKAVTDVVKGKLFTKAAYAISIAVREGDGVTDPGTNFKLRLAIEKARAVNMPKENIDRAIARAVGEGSRRVETILYEGFGPGGVALLIESATDNRQRTVSAVRNLLETSGGNLGSTGSAGYLFDIVGMIILPKNILSYDEVLADALEVGAIDCIEEIHGYVLFTAMHDLFTVKTALEKSGVAPEHTDSVYRAKTSLALSDGDKTKLAMLIENLEELDDVQRVFTNGEDVS